MCDDARTLLPCHAVTIPIWQSQAGDDNVLLMLRIIHPYISFCLMRLYAPSIVIMWKGRERETVFLLCDITGNTVLNVTRNEEITEDESKRKNMKEM